MKHLLLYEGYADNNFQKLSVDQYTNFLKKNEYDEMTEENLKFILDCLPWFDEGIWSVSSTPRLHEASSKKEVILSRFNQLFEKPSDIKLYPHRAVFIGDECMGITITKFQDDWWSVGAHYRSDMSSGNRAHIRYYFDYWVCDGIEAIYEPLKSIFDKVVKKITSD